MRHGLSRSVSFLFRRRAEVSKMPCRKIGVQAQVESTRHEPISHESSPSCRLPEPHALVVSELSHIRRYLLSLLGAAHPGLAAIAEYYFLEPSKQIRSLLVLLFARATNGFGSDWDQKDWEAICETRTGRSSEFDDPLTKSDVLNEWNPSMPDHTTSFDSIFPLQQPAMRPPYPPQMPPSKPARNLSPRLVHRPSVLPTQIRLAQIVEMIHIASLLHEGITSPMDQEGQRHTVPGNHGFGNKVAILGGDFLLGRASWALSRLGESEVVELVASAISNQVEGQFLQVEIQTLGLLPKPKCLHDTWETYLSKTYLKTASLMAKSARSAVILGGCREGDVFRELAYLYGKNLGIAFQLAEDSRHIAQLQPGLVTAPALFAAEECHQLYPLIQRNFSEPGDIKLAVEYIQTTSGVERTHRLAEAYAEKAREVLSLIPSSDTKVALDALIDMVIERT